MLISGGLALLSLSVWLLNLNQSHPFEVYLLEHHASIRLQQYRFRKAIFLENMERVNSHNQQRRSYSLALNQYSHLSFQEFRQIHARKIDVSVTKACNGQIPNATVPQQVDWTKKYVSSVKTQGKCGASWAFSTAGAIEGFLAGKRSILRNISAQQLIDCSDSYGNQGCMGGIMSQGMYYAIDTGMSTEEQYPYSGSKDSCKFKPSMDIYKIGQCSAFSMSNKAFKQAIASYPISAAIDTDNPDFQFYQSGVFTADCGDSVDLGVVVVGFGKDFWKLKLSLGASWGQKGYMMLSNDGKDGPGKCGLQTGGFMVTM